MNNKIIVATTPSDSHTWNLVYIQLLAEEYGFSVVNLGACTSVKDLYRKCKKIMPLAVIVSTINGHGSLEGREIAIALKSIKNDTGVRLIIGGNLCLKRYLDSRRKKELLMAGYDGVYDDAGATQCLKDFLLQLSTDFKGNALNLKAG